MHLSAVAEKNMDDKCQQLTTHKMTYAYKTVMTTMEFVYEQKILFNVPITNVNTPN